jgi:hypothetical protein
MCEDMNIIKKKTITQPNEVSKSSTEVLKSDRESRIYVSVVKKMILRTSNETSKQ